MTFLLLFHKRIQANLEREFSNLSEVTQGFFPSTSLILWLSFVVGSHICSKGFPHALWLSSLYKNEHFQIPI